MAREKPPEDGKYVVKQGEWVGSIALRFGYADWKHDVWMRGENAELRESRPDPRVLAEGDELFVPPWEEKEESCATEQKHTFKLKAPTEVLRIKLLTPDNKPMKNMEYTLTLQWEPGGGMYEQKNKQTDDNGVLEETVPSTTIKGVLFLKKMNQTIKLKFAYLDPLDKNNEKALYRGAAQRLSATGFYPGPISGKLTPALTGAIKSFQQYCSEWKEKLEWVIDAGEVDGKLKDETIKALIKYYGA